MTDPSSSHLNAALDHYWTSLRVRCRWPAMGRSSYRLHLVLDGFIFNTLCLYVSINYVSSEKLCVYVHVKCGSFTTRVRLNNMLMNRRSTTRAYNVVRIICLTNDLKIYIASSVMKC